MKLYFSTTHFITIITFTLILACLAVFPAFPAGAQSGKTVPDYYPMNYDGTGVIDRIGEMEIVIGDIGHGLAVDVTYHTPWSKFAGKYNFEKGAYIGFKLNSQNRIESLWLIEDYTDPRKR